MHDDTSPNAKKYEHRDAHLKLILVSGVALFLSTLVFFLIGYLIMNGFDARGAATEFVASPLADEEAVFTTDVRLQADPRLIFDALKVEQEAQASKWATVSEEPLVYQIPIETAMDIIAKNGFPDVRPNPELPPLESGDKESSDKETGDKETGDEAAH